MRVTLGRGKKTTRAVRGKKGGESGAVIGGTGVLEGEAGEWEEGGVFGVGVA